MMQNIHYTGVPCDFSVTPSPIGLWIFISLGFGLELGLGGLGLGLGLDYFSLCSKLSCLSLLGSGGRYIQYARYFLQLLQDTR